MNMDSSSCVDRCRMRALSQLGFLRSKALTLRGDYIIRCKFSDCSQECLLVYCVMHVN